MYLNVCGPIVMAMRMGDYYFATFVDTYSHHVVVRLMKSKGETIRYTQEYLDHAEIITGEHATHFCITDMGDGTFDTLQAYLHTKGISCKTANEHVPGVESTAAQTAHKLLETTQTMLTDTDWISGHWGDILLHTARTLNWAPTPLIASNCTLREMFTKKKLLVRKLQALESRMRRDVPSINHPAYSSRGPSRRPATASTNSCQASELQMNRFNGESRRLATASTYSLSHLTADEMDLNTEETEGLACRTGPQSI